MARWSSNLHIKPYTQKNVYTYVQELIRNPKRAKVLDCKNWPRGEVDLPIPVLKYLLEKNHLSDYYEKLVRVIFQWKESHTEFLMKAWTSKTKKNVKRNSKWSQKVSSKSSKKLKLINQNDKLKALITMHADKNWNSIYK